MTPRAQIFGILNVTPDSFSDGGRFTDPEAALQHARVMVSEGADVIDVGGESTRPGAARVAPEVERERVIPIVTALARDGIAVSVDTMNADTARAAVRAGALVVNDVSGGLADPGMAAVIAETGTRYVAMHWRGHSDGMAALAQYGDVAREVGDELVQRVAALTAQGVREEQLILDPGLGFAKDAGHNWQVLARLDEVIALGYPVLVGASRKRFLRELPRVEAAAREGSDPRDLPSAVVSALAARAGAWGVRVHDVASTAVALDVTDAWNAGAAS
ncbi:dihydropteroate synthase [Amnibacterium flavum]|uniref:Dihydropteroate synthase n=1 Tax=Amnibacterium flavum TaxID=2173173 RepID=A0A2V1HVY0_9MICO|nr:dihydropteroate synthase [Amnibacterium flavum]PVZ95220.1 dihydropteroate synthase [Amnibacterium flavum]